ncbi:MAG: methyltransferase, partial [Candidatus Methanomethylophilaceae archaeon]
MFGERWIDAIGEGAISGGIGTIMKDLESKVDLDSLDTFIDVGGGHALYSIALSYLHPNLKGTVFDKPHIIKVAERNISDYGSDVSTISGDYYTDDIPGTYDLVFASFNQMCSDPVLVPKIVSVMSPGGYMYIRRHRKAVSENALRNLEWNLAIWEGMPKGQKRHGGEFTQKSEEYIDAMESAGIRMISRETLDNSSEILVFRRCEDGTGSGPGN